MLKDKSFGIIPLSHQNGRWEVFLIQHRHGKYWGFPKGHAERSESPEETAYRELKEETQLEPVRLLQKEPLTEQYHFTKEGRRIFKEVYYFIAEVKGHAEIEKNEISDGVWLPLGEAHEKVTHPEGKAILAQVIHVLEKMR